MRNWWKIFKPHKMTQIVDAGNVFCPVQQRDVDVDRCLSCSFLDEAIPANDHFGQIRCSPSYRALAERVSL